MSGVIRLRVCVAVVQERQIVLVPHYDTDAGPVQWNLPGGAVEFGETMEQAAVREFAEETGFHVMCGELLHIHENVQPALPWHSISIIYQGEITGGEARREQSRYGDKMPRWFAADDLKGVNYYPPLAIEKALRMYGAGI